MDEYVHHVRAMKMYILVRESLPLGRAIVAAAHASLACYLKFRDAPEIAEWLAGPFRKVICKVSDDEFSRAKLFADHVVITESQLDGAEVALAFKPREIWDSSFELLRLYR
jgi:peptidyl-tRNA hydrolase